MSCPLTHADRLLIAGRARTLVERLQRPIESGQAVDNPHQWVREWKTRLPDGTFTQRTNQLVGEADPVTRLQAHGYPADSPPEWTCQLAELTHTLSETDPSEAEFSTVDQPFVHVLEPIAKFGVNELTGSPVDGYLDVVRDDLIEALVTRLAALYEHVLFVEFEAYRTRSDDPDAYTEFVSELLGDGLASFYKEYSFLARVTVRLLSGFATGVTELCERLRADTDELAETFGTGKPPDDLTGVTFTGDAHRRSRQVALVHFESTTVVYKPRPIDLRAGFEALLERLERTLPTPVAKVEYLERDGYGWVEYYEARQSQSKESVEAFYRAAGATTCLLYVLGFTDGFLENVLAVESRPVVVDVETLLHHRGLRSDLVSRQGESDERGTVLDTDLLPRATSESVVTGGAGFGEEELVLESPRRKFTDVNTAEMSMEFTHHERIVGENLAFEGGEPSPDEHLEKILAGFQQTYEALVDERRTVQRDVVATLSDRRGRFLLRPSHQYGTVRKLMSEPSYLRTGLKFGCKLEEFAGPFISAGAPEVGETIRHAEEDALLDFDIPAFYTRSNTRNLNTRHGRVTALFDESGVERTLRRIESLGPTDRDRQSEYIRLAYGDDRTDAAEGERIGTARQVESRTDVRAHVTHIFRRVAQSVQFDDEETPLWIVPKSGPNGGIRIHQTGVGMYEGRAGIAVFLAGLDATYGIPTARELLERTAEPLWQDSEYASAGGLGYGLCSAAYGLSCIGSISRDRDYTSRAVEHLTRLTVDDVQSGTTFGVVAGTAGLLHTLLAIYEQTGDEALLTRARWAGDHLRENRVSRDLVGWIHPETETVLTGFAHGTSGIAAALYRLSDVTGEDQYREVGATAVQSTERVFDSTAGNWADTRPSADSPFVDGWCYGRSGIGIARLIMSETGDDERLRRELEIALDNVVRFRCHDHPCCGNSSKIEFLQTAADRLDIDWPETKAESAIGHRLAKKSPQETFETTWTTDHWTDPTFFKGEAGIGYTLLRSVNPDLPSILAIE